MAATQLDERHHAVVRDLLLADPVVNVFALGILEQWGVAAVRGGRWLGAIQSDGRLQAVGYAGPPDSNGRASIAVAAGDATACEAIGCGMARLGGAAWVIAERPLAEALWRGLGSPARRVESDQILMQAQRVSGGPKLPIRPAAESDLAWVLTAANAMLFEDLGIREPHVLSPTAAIEGEHIGVSDGRSVYRAKLATRCSVGAQIGGIWVPPEMRRQGIGEAATRSLVAHLLGEHPRVTLHVRRDNPTAIECYRRVGFVPERAFKVLVR